MRGRTRRLGRRQATYRRCASRVREVACRVDDELRPESCAKHARPRARSGGGGGASTVAHIQPWKSPPYTESRGGKADKATETPREHVTRAISGQQSFPRRHRHWPALVFFRFLCRLAVAPPEVCSSGALYSWHAPTPPELSRAERRFSVAMQPKALEHAPRHTLTASLSLSLPLRALHHRPCTAETYGQTGGRASRALEKIISSILTLHRTIYTRCNPSIIHLQVMHV